MHENTNDSGYGDHLAESERRLRGRANAARAPQPPAQPGAVPDTARTTEAGRIAATAHTRLDALAALVARTGDQQAMPDDATERSAAFVLDAVRADIDELRWLGAVSELAQRAMPETLHDAAQRVTAAQMLYDQRSVDYCAALAAHAQHEHVGGAVKQRVIKRLMDTQGMSASAADKAASEDAEYRTHRERLSSLMVARDTAQSRMFVAKTNVETQQRFFDALLTAERSKQLSTLHGVGNMLALATGAGRPEPHEGGLA